MQDLPGHRSINPNGVTGLSHLAQGCGFPATLGPCGK